MRAIATYRRCARYPGLTRRCFAVAVVIAAAASSLSFSAPPAVVITRLTDLEFGDAATNATKQILYSDAGAASFSIEATGFIAQTGLTLSLTLPTLLSSGGDTLPISFSSTDAAWSYTNAPAGATMFDPQTGTTVSKNGANFTVYVWIGGRITTDASTTQDNYTSSLTLDVSSQ